MSENQRNTETNIVINDKSQSRCSRAPRWRCCGTFYCYLLQNFWWVMFESIFKNRSTFGEVTDKKVDLPQAPCARKLSCWTRPRSDIRRAV